MFFLNQKLNGVKLEAVAKKKLPPEVLEYFREQGSKGGKLGGKRSLETMTPEERTQRAKRAAAASIVAKNAAAKKKRATKKATKRSK
jgi:hypothetical protein